MRARRVSEVDTDIMHGYTPQGYIHDNPWSEQMTIDRPVRLIVSTNEGRDPRIRRAALHTTDGEECWVHTRGLQLSTWRMVDRTPHWSMTPRLTSNFYTQFRGVLERVTLLSTSWMGGRGRSLQAGDVSYSEMWPAEWLLAVGVCRALTEWGHGHPWATAAGVGGGRVSGVDGESVDVGIDEAEALAWPQPWEIWPGVSLGVQWGPRRAQRSVPEIQRWTAGVDPWPPSSRPCMEALNRLTHENSLSTRWGYISDPARLHDEESRRIPPPSAGTTPGLRAPLVACVSTGWWEVSGARATPALISLSGYKF